MLNHLEMGIVSMSNGVMSQGLSLFHQHGSLVYVTYFIE